jgi:hypothetical protein
MGYYKAWAYEAAGVLISEIFLVGKRYHVLKVTKYET